jgi:hypothetical protein
MLKQALEHLPEAAASPLAFAAYLGVIIAWVIVVWRVKRNKQLLEKIQAFPEEQRHSVLLAEMGSPVPPDFTPESWLRLRQLTYLFYGFISVIIAIVVVVVIALNRKPVAAEITVHTVRVTVTDPAGKPAQNTTLHSSLGGELKKTAGGWELVIPASSVPADGKLTLIAEKTTAFLVGRAELQLGADANYAVTIQLEKDTSAKVRGTVQDVSGNAMPGASVSVVGHADEATLTDANGHFELPAHAADGQMVPLHAEKTGYRSVDQFHPAGDEPAVIQLERR